MHTAYVHIRNPNIHKHGRASLKASEFKAFNGALHLEALPLALAGGLSRGGIGGGRSVNSSLSSSSSRDFILCLEETM